MSDTSKVTPSHTHRAAVIYVRQSSSAQVEHNRESTARQYALVHRAVDLGWHREQVTIIDEDLGLSGSGIAKRAGFARLAADVALAKVGVVLGLEVSRLARNNADWYRLLDLCGMTDDETALAQWRLAVERARYEADRAERRYRAVDPDNRLVARGLEAEWEQRLRDLDVAQRELEARAHRRRRALGQIDAERLRALGDDLRRVWTAPTTTDRDKKELLRALLEEVVLAVDRDERRAHLTLRWRGGTITELPVSLRASPPRIRTDEDSLALIRRLAPHYPDAVIAGILNRQGKRTARGERFTALHVGSLRRYRNIPRCESPAERADGELLTIAKAAAVLGVAPSTLHRWLIAGIIVGEQLTPGAPWRIRMTDELRARFVEDAPPGYLPMLEARLQLGVSRQTVLQRVKRGELAAVHVRRGQRKGLRIKVVTDHPDLFHATP